MRRETPERRSMDEDSNQNVGCNLDSEGSRCSSPDRLSTTSQASSGAKTQTLWQFILQVLDDRPDIAMWVDRREGTFKIVDTKGLSQMWGEKKRNKTMTFEKVSRAIRFTCNSGTMSRCGGGRLMYKFNWPHVPKPYHKN